MAVGIHSLFLLKNNAEAVAKAAAVCPDGKEQSFGRGTRNCRDVARPDAGNPWFKNQVAADCGHSNRQNNRKAGLPVFGNEAQKGRCYQPNCRIVSQFGNERHDHISKAAAQVLLDKVQEGELKRNQRITSFMHLMMTVYQQHLNFRFTAVKQKINYYLNTFEPKDARPY